MNRSFAVGGGCSFWTTMRQHCQAAHSR